jgi:DNA-binding PadR family transcriptional regulator
MRRSHQGSHNGDPADRSTAAPHGADRDRGAAAPEQSKTQIGGGGKAGTSARSSTSQRDEEKPPSGGDPETVYVAAKSNGGSPTVLHLDEDCPQLTTARKVFEKPRNSYHNVKVCSRCGPDTEDELTTPDDDIAGPVCRVGLCESTRVDGSRYCQAHQLFERPREDEDTELITDGGINEVFYTGSGTGSDQTLHVDVDCSGLQHPDTNPVCRASATNAPRGTVCNICAPDVSREDLVEPRVMTDGGVTTTREGVRSMPDPDLTKFQLRILALLTEEARYGLAVKRALEEYYQENVNRSRLYRNLDDLEEDGYVERSQLDRRTNEYAITDAGRDVLQRELEWYADRLGLAIDYSGGDADGV